MTPMKNTNRNLALVAFMAVVALPACGISEPREEAAGMQLGAQAQAAPTTPEPVQPVQPVQPEPPSLQVSADLFGVFSASPTEVWAVGAAGTIIHYGAGWSSEVSPTTQDLRSVWATSDGQGWAVGAGGTIVHRNGNISWVAALSPTTEDLYGVWGSSRDSVWAVGSTGIILHWNGASWSVVHSRGAGVLRAVWGTSASDVWAVGSGKEPDGDYAALLLHWNGTSWTESYVCNPEGTSHASGGWAAVLSDVWGAGATVWAAGRCQSGASFIPYGYVAEKVGNSGWGDTAGFGFGQPLGKYRPLQTIWSSSASDAWAASASETVNGAPTPPTMLHWDGTSWTPSTQVDTVGINDLGGSAANDIWAVGLGGKRLHYNGTTWSATP